MESLSYMDANVGFNYDYNTNSYFYGPFNHVRDFNKLQGMTHASDQHIQPLRDLNHRYISIENSGQRPVGIAIRTYGSLYSDGYPSGGVTYKCYNPYETNECSSCTNTNFTPQIDFVLGAGEIKNLSINTIGEPTQYIYPLNPIRGPQYGLRVGSMTALDRNVNQFVYRDGLNGGFFQKFHRVGYKG